MTTESTPRVLSAGSLKGDKVVNHRGENLGKIEDIMIETGAGQISYAVLSFGGLLGMGDKLFAIPWSSLQLEPGSKRFLLDMDKEELENAPGFDKDNWPDMADPQFKTSIHGYYGVSLTGS